MKIKYIIVAGIVSICFSAHAQNAWTLKECIDYATEHNIDVRKRILEHRKQEINVNTAQWSRLPDLNSSMDQSFYFGRGPGRDGTYQDQSQASSSFGISTSVPVFNGLRIMNQVRARKFDLQAAIEDLNKAKEDLALNVTAYYLKVLLNKELERIAADQIKLSQLQLQNTEVLVNNGKSPESELYESRATLAKDEVSLTDASNNLKLSLLDLSQLLNLDSLEGFDVSIPDVDGVVLNEALKLMTPSEVYTRSIGNRPAIKAAENSLQSSIKNLKITKADFYPSLSFGASYNNSYYHTYNLAEEETNTSFARQIRHNGSESVRLSLNIPIFNRLATRNQVRVSRLSIEGQELALQEAKQALFKEIQQAYYNASAAHATFRSSEKAVEASQIAFKYEEQKYIAGKSTTFQYNDVKMRLTKSLSDLAQAKYDFIFSSKILDFYNGQPLY